MSEKTLQELEALRNRLVVDVRRSQQLDPNGLTRNTPLVRNLEEVNKKIAEKKKV